MFFIPGQLVAILTFPGVIIHEIAHRFFADLSGVPVYQVCYIRAGNPAGYVIHGPAKNLRQAFLIAVGPLFINTFLCALLTFFAMYPIFILKTSGLTMPLFGVLLWAGLSIGMHAFPSPEDLNGFVNAVERSNGKGLLYWLAKLFSGLFKLAHWLKVAWFDLIYAIGVSFVLPILFGTF